MQDFIMNEKKLMQLSGMTASAIASLEFQQQQLNVAQQHLMVNSRTIQSNIEVIINNLTAIAANPPPLNKTDIEILAKLKTNLHKISSEIGKDIERPAMQFKKELDHIQVTIRDKISKELVKPSTFNLDPLRKSLGKAQDLIQKNSLEIDKLLLELSKCQNKLAQAETQLHRLNLPNEIATTTKELTKVTKDLGGLQSHLALNPNVRELYQSQFLPLYDALEKLRLQSNALTPMAAANRATPKGP